MLSKALAVLPLAAAYQWPDPKVDHIEAIYYQQAGHNGLQFAGVIPSCGFDLNFVNQGRTNTAEWIRLAYHDMATADVHAGTGGLDASISFELDRAENIGSAFKDALNIFKPFVSSRSPMADLIALGAVMAVTSCTVNSAGPPLRIPFRAGRVDANGPGPSGVPEPHQDLATHTAKFAAQGFNASEMIALVMCGHTLGGVHGVDFPTIVDDLHDPRNTESKQAFDDTVASFDNHVATQFVAGNNTQNPLAFGHNETTRSDQRIFTSDGGDMAGRMAASNDFFLSTCSTLLERMVNTVPKGVQLSAPIDPIYVKPDGFDMVVNTDSTITITGILRVAETPNGRAPPVLYFKSRSGIEYPGANSSIVDVGQGVFPRAPSFTWYKYSTTVPSAQGFSSFNIAMFDHSGVPTSTETNGGNGFPLSSDIIPQLKLSCSSIAPYRVNVTAAVRDDAAFDSVILSAAIPVQQTGSTVPGFETQKIQMKKTAPIGTSGYSLYTGVIDTTKPNRFINVLFYDLIGQRAGGNVEVLGNRWDQLASC